MQSKGYREDTHKDQRIHGGYTYRAEDTQRIHIQIRGYTGDAHTEKRIHRGYTYNAEYIYTEDTHIEQRIHIQSRGYTEDTYTEQRTKIKRIQSTTSEQRRQMHSRVYTVHIQRRAEDGTEQRKTQSRGRNTKAEAGTGTVPKEKQTKHLQNIFKLGSSIEITKRNWV